MKLADVLTDGLVLWLRVVEGVCLAYVELDRRARRYARGPTRAGAEAWLWDEERDGELPGDGMRKCLRWRRIYSRCKPKQKAIDAADGGTLTRLQLLYAWDDYVREMQARQEDMEANTYGRDE
jgi:hypothetical protein